MLQAWGTASAKALRQGSVHIWGIHRLTWPDKASGGEDWQDRNMNSSLYMNCSYYAVC